MNKKALAILLALGAAVLYAVNIPVSKLLMADCQPAMLAGLLYIGAGLGMGATMLLGKALGKGEPQPLLGKEDLPYAVAMVALDIAAPIFLMFGIRQTNAANVSLLNNFEIVATSVIALGVFREKISPRLWAAIGLVVFSGIILGFEGTEGLVLNRGSAFVLGACLCWGIENNCTRSISEKSAQQIVVVKGLGSGIGGVTVALGLGERFPDFVPMLHILLLGFLSYGLSINFYIMAQKDLGAAKTSAYYSVAPFLGVGFSFLLLGEQSGLRFYVALAVMAAATVFLIRDTLGAEAGYSHSHAHRHGDVVHTHAHCHSTLSPVHIHLHGHREKT